MVKDIKMNEGGGVIMGYKRLLIPKGRPERGRGGAIAINLLKS